MLYDDKVIDNTFWEDFTIAEAFGVNAVKDTFKRAFLNWKDDIYMATALTVTVNHKRWQRHANKNTELTELYSNYYYKCFDYILEDGRYEADELKYFLRIID